MGRSVSFLIAATTWSALAVGAGIDQHDAVGSDLDADVAAGAGDHIEIRPHLDDVKIGGLARMAPAASRPRITIHFTVLRLFPQAEISYPILAK